MTATDDYAELCSLRERLRFVALGLIVFGAVYLLWQHWGLPRWEAFASNPQCYRLWGVEGVSLLFYGLFVGLPLSLALLGGLLSSRRGLRVLRDGQSPYRGEKVLRRTRIRRGNAARLIGWVQLLAPLGFVFIALWGAGAAHQLVTHSAAAAPVCQQLPADR